MAGSTPWQTLIDRMSPERRAESDARVKAMREELRAQEEAAARLDSEKWAEVIGVTGTQLENLEVGNLSKRVTQLGGHLELVAHLPSGDVSLDFENP